MTVLVSYIINDLYILENSGTFYICQGLSAFPEACHTSILCSLPSTLKP